MKKLDLFIGADCLNALAGWVLKKIGKVKKVVFYSIDYIPVRFKNPFLNFIYHLIDRFCVKHCDAVWNLTERMSKVRAKFAGASKQKVVPAGADLKNSYYYENPDLEKNSLVYMGSLSKNNGLDLAILAVAEIKKQFPDVCLRIIGHGPEEENLKELVKKEGLEKEVRFLGYIQERKKMFDIIARSYLALALYKPEGNKEEYMAKLSWFGGSAKVLDYLVCGTPVLITSVPEIALEIEKENAGILVDFEKDKIVEAVLELFKNPEKLFFLREKARLFALKKDWTKIFKEALYF